eukprot:4281162-Amphidinium_carterae.2
MVRCKFASFSVRCRFRIFHICEVSCSESMVVARFEVMHGCAHVEGNCVCEKHAGRGLIRISLLGSSL